MRPQVITMSSPVFSKTRLLYLRCKLSIMRRFWPAYGSPKNPDSLKSAQETPYIAACANRELGSLFLGGDNVTVKFDDDTIWYDTTKPDHGHAVVKLLLDITLRDKHEQKASLPHPDSSLCCSVDPLSLGLANSSQCCRNGHPLQRRM